MTDPRRPTVDRQLKGREVIASMPSLVTADVRAPSSRATAPSLPMLIVFGAALVGVLVEAFAPRAAPPDHPAGR